VKGVRALAALMVLLAVAAPAGAQVARGFFETDGIAPFAGNSHLNLRLSRAGLSDAGTFALSARDFLTLGGSYDVLLRRFFIGSNVRVDGTEVRSGDYLRDNHLTDPLHAVAVGASYAHAFSPRWAIVASLAGGYAGDFHRFDVRDARPTASLGAAVRLHPTFLLSFGLSHREAFRPWFSTPYLGWEWRPRPWFHSEARLPRSIDFTFVFLGRVEAAVFGLVEGHDYRVQENRLGFDRLLYVEARGGVSMGIRIIDDLWLAVQGGVSPYRELSGRGAGDDEVWGGRMANSWFARVALDLRGLAGHTTPPAVGETP
jgi:hypothetical protein